MHEGEQSGPITEPLWNGAGQQLKVRATQIFCGNFVPETCGRDKIFAQLALRKLQKYNHTRRAATCPPFIFFCVPSCDLVSAA